VKERKKRWGANKKTDIDVDGVDVLSAKDLLTSGTNAPVRLRHAAKMRRSHLLEHKIAVFDSSTASPTFLLTDVGNGYCAYMGPKGQERHAESSSELHEPSDGHPWPEAVLRPFIVC
jgi:hypothetical protein